MISTFPRRLAFALLLAAHSAGPAFAQAHDSHAGHGTPAATAAAAAELTRAEVRKVDRATGKLTLRHEEIRNLGMPPMTMVFQVARPALLDGLQAGDPVRFAADKIGGAYTVTRIEKASP